MALSVEMPWRELREHLAASRDEALETFERRVETMYEAGQLPELWSEVTDRVFLEDAVRDEAVAAQALRVLTAMVWHTPDVEQLHTWLRERGATRMHPMLSRDLDEDTALAYRMFRVRNEKRVSLPDALIRVFARHSLVTAAARERAWRDLERAYDEPLQLLHHCELVAWHDHDLASTLIPRAHAEVPRRRATFDALPVDVAAALGRALAAIPRRGLVKGIADRVADVAQVLRYERVLYPPFRPRNYTEHVRPAVARVLLEVGVPLVTAFGAIKSSRLWLRRYRRAFLGDLGLQLYSSLAALIHAHREPPPVHVSAPYR